MKFFALAFVSMLLVPVQSVKIAETSTVSANPIRKVVTMLQAMQKKIEAEAVKEEALYTKYMCYCTTSGGDLQKSISAADVKVPQVQSDIEESEAQKIQLDSDLVDHKADRVSAKKAMADATAIREKEAAAFAAEKSEADENVAAISKAVTALEKGMAGAFLQTTAANKLRNLVQSVVNLDEENRHDLYAFLTASQDQMYSPQSGQITGLLKQLSDDMSANLAEAAAAEEASLKNYGELMAAKKKQIGALTASIEEKTVRAGEVAVNIVNMKNDLSDTDAALIEDKAFLADMSKNCDTKTAEWNEIVKVRAQEALALAETIKILQDDDALELFKKTLPSASASLLQRTASSASAKARALSVIHDAQQKSTTARQQLNFIALALHGKAKGFEKVLAMIDEMVEVLGKEQLDDDAKKIYCGREFDSSDDQKKSLERSISDSGTSIASAEESISTLASELEALATSIKALDKSVAEATELRKSENADFTDLIAQNTAAKELLGIAKNRLQQFYNPALHVAAKKRELSSEDRIVVNFGGTAAPTPAPGGIAGTGVTVLAQVSASVQQKGAQNVAPPPAPEAPGAYSKKSGESNGVIAMIDMLIGDLDKEMTVAETEEKNAQADYESMLKDSAAKRAADSKSITEKESAKADTQAALEGHVEDKASASRELGATLETIHALHSECDWLLQNFAVRKEARAGEVESLKNAKAVLSGADYSLVQTRSRSLRGHF